MFALSRVLDGVSNDNANMFNIIEQSLQTKIPGSFKIKNQIKDPIITSNKFSC